MKAIYLLTLFFLLLAQGCTGANGLLEYGDNKTPEVNYLPFGIPLLLGGHGTSVPLTENVSITAKHVAQLHPSLVIAHHPDCDLSLIKQDNSDKPLPTLGIIFSYQPVTTVGTNMWGESLVGEGIYYRDIFLPGHELFARCPASLVDAPVQSGMSGGGVYNANRELVGIISAKAYEVQLADGTIIETDRVSLFVPLLFARDWLVKNLDSYYEQNPHLDSDMQAAFSSAFNIDLSPFKPSALSPESE
ncbi:hypothetical protein BIY21_18890 [Vibrio ponticus]|uniref:Trypsin-like peptidase domain-containing protein n=1 Tax=Vibrio ponticus TaxID=265668 RepID=A0ABX3F9A1_9VIBR|nr:trypsin-like peptidase domain-containing protein [Vibrio ponticus]OLQ85698.1 hypothetical protein BIY21_18890 [Vibrio ponticus]